MSAIRCRIEAVDAAGVHVIAAGRPWGPLESLGDPTPGTGGVLLRLDDGEAVVLLPASAGRPGDPGRPGAGLQIAGSVVGQDQLPPPPSQPELWIVAPDHGHAAGTFVVSTRQPDGTWAWADASLGSGGAGGHVDCRGRLVP